MPQTPQSPPSNVATDARNPLRRVPLFRDRTGAVVTQWGGVAPVTKLESFRVENGNLIMLPGPVALVRVAVIRPGTAGAFGLWDADAAADIGDANAVWTLPRATAAPGAVYRFGATPRNLPAPGQIIYANLIALAPTGGAMLVTFRG